MSPILVRPVREQLEHDRVIRLLQTRFKRRYEVAINPGAEQNASVGGGTMPLYPDLILQTNERGRRVVAVVEVETGESVNHLEALAQWAHFAKLRAAFHLYVPSGMVDVARRLCEDNQIQVNEVWSYHTVAEEVRFTLVHRTRETAHAAHTTSAPRPKSKPSPAKPAKPAPAKPAKPARAVKRPVRAKATKKAKRR